MARCLGIALTETLAPFVAPGIAEANPEVGGTKQKQCGRRNHNSVPPQPKYIDQLASKVAWLALMPENMKI